MKILTVRQPNAFLAVTGVCDLIDQDEPTVYMGPILIHASVHPPLEDEIQNQLYRDGSVWHDYSGTATTPGGVVGAVMVDGCVTKSDSKWFQEQSPQDNHRERRG